MQTIEQQYGKALLERKFDKLIKIKREIVAKFGKRGILYLLEREVFGSTTYLVNITDKTCPWFIYKELSTPDAIEQIWGALVNKLPHFIELLKERCQGLIVIQHNNAWQLVYVLDILSEDELPFFTFYIGDEPITSEEEANRTNISNAYQHHLGSIYKIHNGLGELGSESILPFDELTTIKCNDIFYLSFFDFVSKARQCIKIEDLKQENPITYDYDRGNIQVYHPFWSFLDERLALFDDE